jgi:uncharacterized protein (DUF58 family)
MALTGRLVLCAALGAIPVVMYPGALPILAWLALLLAAVALDLGYAAPPRMAAFERTVPESARLTTDCASILTVGNRSGRVLRALVRDGWQPSAGADGNVQRLAVPAGETRRMVVRLKPERRGHLQSRHVTVRSFGPLGLAARQATFDVPGVLRVLPAFHSRRHLPSRLRRLRELDGNSSVQIRGGGTEFDSLRDYVGGDDVRSIDWRATARRRDLVVRTWRPERDRRVVIVLDTSRTAAARIGDEPRLDTGIEAALLLAVLARHGGDRVDFLAFDRRLRARVRSAAKGNLLGSLVTAMAPLQPELIEADWSQLPGHISALSTQRCLVVLLTSLDSGAVEEGLLPVLGGLAARHLVLVASVRDPELDRSRTVRDTATDTYRAAAAERALLDRAAVAALLRQSGADVVDETAHDLPPRLADTYLKLKAAGRL